MNPTCFISYSWDSEVHKVWVRVLAERIQAGGVTTYLDQWDIRPGADLTHYMETRVRESDFVLLICTPIFAEKANLGLGGVGYEKTIVTGEIFRCLGPTTKFVPLLRMGDQKTGLPSYLQSKAFIDFRREDDFDKNLETLLRHFHGSSEIERPQLGPKPTFGSQQTLPSAAPSNGGHKSRLLTFEELHDYAFGASGLNLTKKQAVAWAEDKMTRSATFDLEAFHKLFCYAYGADGLNLTRQQALRWAEDKMRTGR